MVLVLSLVAGQGELYLRWAFGNLQMNGREKTFMHITQNSYIHWVSFGWKPQKTILATLIEKDLLEGNFIGRLDSGGYVVDSRANQPTIPGKDRKLQEQMESESSLCSPPSEDSEKVAVYSPGSGPSPKLDKTGTLIDHRFAGTFKMEFAASCL